MHPRIEQFVLEYLVDLNAAAAARRCGYPEASAAYRGSKLMKRRDVQRAVKQAMAARAERTGITADRVLGEYARNAFADARDYYDWGPWGVKLRPASGLSADTAAAVRIIRRGRNKGAPLMYLRLHDKHRALKMLARHVGLCADSRRTYTLRPDDNLNGPAGAARSGQAALAILRQEIEAKDEALMRLAHEIEAAWRHVFGPRTATGN
jgi:phage terminase small subunit